MMTRPQFPNITHGDFAPGEWRGRTASLRLDPSFETVAIVHVLDLPVGAYIFLDVHTFVDRNVPAIDVGEVRPVKFGIPVDGMVGRSFPEPSWYLESIASMWRLAKNLEHDTWTHDAASIIRIETTILTTIWW